jgi:D-alanyl-D-alanine carboxypeptidase
MPDLQPALPADVEIRIDAIAQGFLSALEIPGMTVGLQASGRAAFVKGYGYANLENDIPAASWTVYRIGSLTKQFTAAAILMLIERGALALTDTLGALLPRYPRRGRAITVEQLLTHTAGIRNFTDLPEFAARARVDLPHEELAHMFVNKPLEFRPGTRYQYSNSNYYLLGLIIEVLTKQPYYEFMEQEVFRPLQLTETTYLDDYRICKHRSDGYERWNGRMINAGQISMIPPFAAGALGSTAPNLLAWQAALVSHRLISEDSFRRMTTSGTLKDGSRTGYGYGVMIGRMEGRQKFVHGGSISGFRSQLAYYPDDGLTVVILCNHGNATPEVIESRLAREVLGIPERTIEEIPQPERALKKLVGKYASGSAAAPVELKDGVLHFSGAPLRPTGDHTFVLAHDPYAEVTFHKGVLTIEREGQRMEYQR